jgi:hypothetical protein
VPVQAPAALRDLPDLGGGVVECLHGGGVVRVTTLERSLVDVLDAPERNGGWEEVWRSLEMVEYFDLDAVLAYTRVLGSALTAARVGFFLAQHRDAFRDLAPAQPRYLDAGREPGKLEPGRARARADSFLGRGELMLSQAALQQILRGHPGLRWNALNVRRHRG